MRQRKWQNTLQKGAVRFVIFGENGVWYAAGLEFNIVESGSTPQEAMVLLFEALQGYVESARKVRARPHVLNQRPDSEYEALWSRARGASPAPRVGKQKIFSAGWLRIGKGAAYAFAPA